MPRRSDETAGAPLKVRLTPGERERAEAVLLEGETLSDAIRAGLEVLAAVRQVTVPQGLGELEWLRMAGDDHAAVSTLVVELEERATGGKADERDLQLLQRLDPVVHARVTSAGERRRRK